MATRAGIRPDEGLMMMQELDDRLKEQNDKLEHVRLAAVELKDNLSGVNYTGNKSLSIRTTVWSLFFTELSSVLTLFSSNTEQRWSKPVYCWPSGVVESLVRASGDSSHEHNCFRPGKKGMQFPMGSWLYFYLWQLMGAHLAVHSASVSSLTSASSVSRWTPSLAHGRGDRVPNTATAWDASTRLTMPSRSLAGPPSAHGETVTPPPKCPVTGDLLDHWPIDQLRLQVNADWWLKTKLFAHLCFYWYT